MSFPFSYSLFIYLFTLSSCSVILSLLFYIIALMFCFLLQSQISQEKDAPTSHKQFHINPVVMEVRTAAHFEQFNRDIFDVMSRYFLEVLEGRVSCLHTNCRSHDPTKSIISEKISSEVMLVINCMKLFIHQRLLCDICGIFSVCCS